MGSKQDRYLVEGSSPSYRSFIEFLEGQGWIGEAILAKDWESTSIGPMSSWPLSLRNILRFVLTTRQSINFFWGPDLHQFFNETYSPTLNGMPGDPIGAPFLEFWGEVFEGVRPYYERAIKGEGTWKDDLPLTLTRNGITEQTYWTFSYSPLYDDEGSIAGFMNVVNETTKDVRIRQELERVQGELAAEREQLATMFEQSPSFIAVLRGPEHVVTLANPAYRKLVGHRDVIGKTLAEALPDAAAQGYVDIVDEVYRSGIAYTADSALYSAQPEPGAPVVDTYVDFVIQPLRNAAGEVDGILVDGIDVSERLAAVSALRKSEERLRLVVDAAEDYAIITVAEDRRVTSWSKGATKIFGWDAEEMIGQPIDQIFTIEDREAGIPQREIVAAAKNGVGRDVRWHQRADGSKVFMDGSVRPLASDGGGFLKIARDATSDKMLAARQEARLQLNDRLHDVSDPDEIAFQASQILGTALDASLVGYATVENDEETLVVARDWASKGIPGLSGQRLHFRAYGSYIDDLKEGRTVVVADIHADPRTRDNAQALLEHHTAAFVNFPVIEHGRFVAMLYVCAGQPRRWSADDLALVRDVGERVRSATARIFAEREQEILNHELGHRLKNTFALVQAIAAQTLKNVSERDVVDVLNQRLSALSSAHDVLLGNNWTRASMRSAVANSLRALAQADRFDVSGPDFELGPRSTLSLGMLLHELATNAIKYGALSSETGRVALSWTADRDSRTLTLTWRETGGPPAVEPSRKGFGSRLIRMGLTGTGGVELSYRPTGFEAVMTAPLGQLEES